VTLRPPVPDAVTSDNGVTDRTTHGNRPVVDVRDSTRSADIDLSSAETLRELAREEADYQRILTRERHIRAARHELDTEGQPAFEADDVDEFLDGPAQSYLVPRMLYRDGLAVVFGAPGAAKSFLMLDICLSLTSGAMWMLGGEVRIDGRDGGPGIAHYVMAEGAGTNRARTRAWLYHRGVDRAAIK